MDTRFSKFSDVYGADGNSLPVWAHYFHAGTDWLISLQILTDNRDDTFSGIFYVETTIVAFCLELFVKALAAHEDVTFTAKYFSHRTSKIIEEYAERIPIFKRLSIDGEIMELIKEYQKTVDARYGETYINLVSKERDRLIALTYELRAEMCNRTGLH